MQAELYALIRTEVARIQKVEWLSAYAVARIQAFSSTNIESAWCGAGLLPFDRSKVLNRIPQPSPSPLPRSSTLESATPFDIHSSPLNISAVHNANIEMRRRLSSNQSIETPCPSSYRPFSKIDGKVLGSD